MAEKYSLMTRVRFPAVFATFLSVGTVAFILRNEILGDFEEEKKSMFKREDSAGAELLQQKIMEHQAKKYN